MTALLEVLSVGKGDIKMTFGDDPDEVAKARTLIGNMLRDGYVIMVDTARGLKPVKRFDKRHAEYIVSDKPETPKAKPERRVPFAGSRARAVGATAGG